jgi:hypothetical protein
VLDEIDSVPGGAAGWVTGHGTDPDPLERLRRRLLSPGAHAADRRLIS